MVADPKQIICPSQDGEGDGEDTGERGLLMSKSRSLTRTLISTRAVYPFVCPYLVPGELDNLKIKSIILCSGAPECEQSVFHLAR